MLNAHLYDWKEIVIGGTLNAAQYALKRGSHFIFNNVNRIFALDGVDNEISLGLTKKSLFEDCLYELNLRGLNPLMNICKTINISTCDKTLNVVSKQDNKFIINYSNLHVFDYENVSGLPFDLPNPIGYDVYDWFNVRSGMKHHYNELSDSNSEFVKKIYFYSSERFKGRPSYKDLVAHSYLCEPDLHSVSNDTTHARLKATNMLNTAGVKGSRSGKNRSRPIVLEFSKREIIPKYDTIYMKEGNIEITLES